MRSRCGPEAALEHIYVNSVPLVWQWLRSPPALAQEVGIEAASMWKIRERLYLLATRGEHVHQSDFGAREAGR